MPRKPISRPGEDRPLRVLLIDDHEISRAACRALLHAEGVDVVNDMSNADVTTGSAHQHAPQVVIIDVGPGDRSGFALAQRLRSSSRAPLIVLTSSSEQMMRDARLKGFAFIAKADLCARRIVRTLKAEG